MCDFIVQVIDSVVLLIVALLCVILLCSQLEQAANVAFHNKNIEELNLVLSKCGTSNRTLAERVNSLKQQLGAKQ